MQIIGGEIVHNELTKNAMGGSELMAGRLFASLPKSLLQDYQIILSRVRELDSTKVRILWCHDLAQDNEAFHLANEGWKKFHLIVFVSYWQRQQFIDRYNIPYGKTVVMQNAIIPFDRSQRTLGQKIRFIYHTTPHRGLELLVPVFQKLAEDFKNIHLDVYSSFGVYGWPQRDAQYEGLFDIIKNDPHMTYHGAKSNDEVRKALLGADIFAYPSVWMETSCLALIEAMSAGLICVHPNLGALPETAANCTFMYNFTEDHNQHANIIYQVLHSMLDNINMGNKSFENKTHMASDYVNAFYDWNIRAMQWQTLLESWKNEPRELPIDKGENFVYNVV